jgi:hypothetical protein
LHHHYLHQACLHQPFVTPCLKRFASNAAYLKRHWRRRHAMNPMLNLCEGHVFVELNYPHIIGVLGY